MTIKAPSWRHKLNPEDMKCIHSDLAFLLYITPNSFFLGMQRNRRRFLSKSPCYTMLALLYCSKEGSSKLRIS